METQQSPNAPASEERAPVPGAASPAGAPGSSRHATRLAFILVFLLIAGAISAIVLPQGAPGVGAATLVYAFSATVAAIGIWRQHRWAATAFATWTGIAILCGLLMGVFQSGPMSEAGLVVVLCGGFWLVYRRVRRQPAAGGRE
jgi:hypothetical protein